MCGALAALRRPSGVARAAQPLAHLGGTELRGGRRPTAGGAAGPCAREPARLVRGHQPACDGPVEPPGAAEGLPKALRVQGGVKRVRHMASKGQFGARRRRLRRVQEPVRALIEGGSSNCPRCFATSRDVFPAETAPKSPPRIACRL